MERIIVLSVALFSLTTTFAQPAKSKKTNPVTEKVTKAEEKVVKAESKVAKAEEKLAKTKEKANVSKEKVNAKAKVESLKKGGREVASEIKAVNPTSLEKIEPQGEVKLTENGVTQVAPIQPAQTTPAAAMQDPNKNFEFTNDNYDFGKIPAGKPAKYTLSIKNISAQEQTLTLVQPGCGCTTPEYVQGQKFGPGETVKVVLGFNGGSPSSGAPFSKAVTVTLAGHNPKTVTFKGETFAVPTESAPTNESTDKLKPAGN